MAASGREPADSVLVAALAAGTTQAEAVEAAFRDRLTPELRQARRDLVDPAYQYRPEEAARFTDVVNPLQAVTQAAPMV